LREATDLAASLKLILRENASPDLLADYDQRHRAEWRALMGLNGDPKPAPSADEWVKEHRAKILAAIPASGADLTHLLKHLGLEFEPVSANSLHAPA
jgi:hypothetical protein